MKKNGLLKIISIIALALLILSWIIPASYFSGSEMVNVGLYRIGLFDIINYPVLAIQYFIQLLLLIVAIGGFYGVLSETGKYRNTLEKIAKSLKGKEIYFLVITAFVLAALSSVFGLGVFLFIFVPALIGIILLMGYDKFTAMLVTFAAIMVGVIGSTFSPYVTGYIAQYTGTDYLTAIWFKVGLFVVTFVIYILFTILYAKKHKSKEKIESDNVIPFIGEKKQVKRHSWPLYLIFGLLFVVLILSTTNWDTVFKINWFTDLHTTITTWAIKDHTIVSYVLGNISNFGKWYYAETILILMIASVTIGFIYKLKFDEILASFGKGIVKMLKPAFIVVFAMVIVIITAYHRFYMTISDWIIGLSKDFNIFLTSIVAIFGSLFNVEVIYFAQSVVAYLIGTFTSETAINAIVLITQSFYGLTMLVAPTSTMLILGLEFLNIPYIEWIKKSWKLILSLLVAILVAIVLIVLI